MFDETGRIPRVVSLTLGGMGWDRQYCLHLPGNPRVPRKTKFPTIQEIPDQVRYNVTMKHLVYPSHQTHVLETL